MEASVRLYACMWPVIWIRTLKGTMRVPVSALAMLTIVAPFASVPQAHAGVRICKSNYTDSNDRARLSAAMREVFPLGVRADGIPYVCRNRGSAGASLSTWAHLRPDGVTEWWTVTCERKARDWQCEAPERQQLIWVFAEVGGVMRRLEVSFDEATALAEAQRSAVRAIRIIQDSLAPLPACGSTLDAQREWEKVQRAYALTPTDTAVALDVETERAGVVTVTRYSTLKLTFTDGSSELSAGTGACWAEWIVIG